MDIRLKRAMEAYLDTRGRAASASRTAYKFPWRSGPNRMVLLPFIHRVQEADLLRSGRTSLGLTPEDVGKELPFLVVPRVRYYFGPRGRSTYVTNGLGTLDCPLLRAWLDEESLPKSDRRNPEPQDEFVVNVVCLDQPERGVLQCGFRRSEWLGVQDRNRKKVTYGIWDIIAGYTPPGEVSGLREGEVPLGGAGPVLPAIEPWDENKKGPLLGLKGREIIVMKRAGTVGRSPVLVIDDEVQGGPLRLGPPVNLPAEIFGQGAPKGVKDILLDPSCFPGWSSNGEHLTEEAAAFTAQAVGARKRVSVPAPEMSVVAATPAIEEEVGQPLPTEPPILPSVQQEPAKPRKRAKVPKSDVQVGDTVHWTEGGVTYIGRVHKFFTEAGVEKAEVEVSEDEQQSEQAKADVRQLFETVGPDAVARVARRLLMK